MTLQELQPHIMPGGAVRQVGWIPNVQIQWDWAKGWMVSVDHGKTWETTSLHPSPLYMFKDDWEAV